MPRVLTAFIVGAMLAIAGVLLQGVLRNPLADASVLGVTSMGGAGAMLLLVVISGHSSSIYAVWRSSRSCSCSWHYFADRHGKTTSNRCSSL